MSVIKTAKLRRALLKKGFREQQGRHRRYWFYDGDRRSSIGTGISHGSREYSDGLLSKVASQLGMDSKRQLLDFVACPLDEDGYREHLVQTGQLRRGT